MTVTKSYDDINDWSQLIREINAAGRKLDEIVSPTSDLRTEIENLQQAANVLAEDAADWLDAQADAE